MQIQPRIYEYSAIRYILHNNNTTKGRNRARARYMYILLSRGEQQLPFSLSFI